MKFVVNILQESKMAKFKKREFYELCGVTKSYFYQYIKRGKIFAGSDGLIDTELPMNAEFMATRVLNKKNVPAPPVVSVVEQPPTKAQTKIQLNEIARKEKMEDKFEEQATHKFNLDRQIKEADLEAKEQTIELNRLKIAKMSGEVIPTQLVIDVFAQHFKGITVSMHQGCDNFLMTIAKVSGMKKADLARMRGELIEIVNEAVRDGVQDSKDSVKNIVGEYSNRRGVGERK
jgi:hypothetical protein